jgi:hypothetical protein
VPSWVIVVGIGVLIGAVLVVSAVKRSDHHSAAPLPTVSSRAGATPVAGLGPGVDLGETTAVDLAMARGLLYVLTREPARLGQVNARTGAVTRQITAPEGASHVYADQAGERVWVAADDLVFAYDGPTLASIGQVQLNRPVTSAAALDGRLYIGTDHGVYVATAPTYYLGSPVTVRPLSGFSGQVVQTIAADPARHRLLAVTVNYELLEVKATGVRFVRQLRNLLPESIAVTRSAIWIIGYGDPGVSRIGRLDPKTMTITPVGSGDADAPQGASAWPGSDVFWVRNNSTDDLTCRDARTGEIAQTLSGVPGPVTSTGGAAYAVRAGVAIRLQVAALCPG